MLFGVTVVTLGQESNHHFFADTGTVVSPMTKMVRTVQLHIPEITPFKPGTMLRAVLASNGYVKWHQSLQINSI